MGELGDLYAIGRDRIIDLVRGADPVTPVPTCPAWTVKDVLAHVTGIPADIIAGRLDGVATDRWTAAQVEARRDKTVDEITAAGVKFEVYTGEMQTDEKGIVRGGDRGPDIAWFRDPSGNILAAVEHAEHVEVLPPVSRIGMLT